MTDGDAPSGRPPYDAGQGEPPAGGPSPGGTPYGQPPYGQAPYGQPPYGQAPYGQPPYGQRPYGQPPYRRPGSGRDGTIALVCGIVGLFFFNIILGPIAIYFGNRARRFAPSGSATAGFVLGIIDTVLGVVSLFVIARLAAGGGH